MSKQKAKQRIRARQRGRCVRERVSRAEQSRRRNMRSLSRSATRQWHARTPAAALLLNSATHVHRPRRNSASRDRGLCLW